MIYKNTYKSNVYVIFYTWNELIERIKTGVLYLFNADYRLKNPVLSGKVCAL